MSDKNKKEIIARLNVVINLLLRMCSEKGVKITTKEQIKILAEMGLSSGDIGRILGKEPRYVTANLSQLRCKRRR